MTTKSASTLGAALAALTAQVADEKTAGKMRLFVLAALLESPVCLPVHIEGETYDALLSRVLTDDAGAADAVMRAARAVKQGQAFGEGLVVEALRSSGEWTDIAARFVQCASDARISEFHDLNGTAWGLIEGAGMAHGDRHTGGLYASHSEAHAARKSQYEPDEIESLTVAIARWDRDGEFWSYDF